MRSPEKTTLADTRPAEPTIRTARRGAPSEVALGRGNFSPSPIIARNKAPASPFSQSSSETLLAAAMSLPADERARLIAQLRAGSRRAIRPDYRRHVSISVDEAADLIGMDRKTIHNALWSGRIQRAGVGRYCVDQSSVLKAFARRGRRA